jgi:RNA polymerase sigma factor (sigma-70 family)
LSHTHPQDAQLIRLLSHREWLEGLAVRLVGDEHTAADLVQDTLLAVITRRPAEGASLRGWLRTVLVRGVIQYRKTESCRRAREIARERKEAFPSPEEITERTDAHHRIVAAVLALEEPYKSTLLLRFYDGYPPRTIAERTNTPVETVKTRIKRGLAQLRLTLEEEGDRGTHAIAVLLVPALLRPLPKLAATVQVAAVAGLCLLGVGGWTLFSSIGDATDELDDSTALAQELSVDGAPDLRDEVEQPDARTPLADEAVAQTDHDVPAGVMLRGMAFDVEGHPLSGARVGAIEADYHARDIDGVEYIGLSEPVEIAISAVDGSFEIPQQYSGWLLSPMEADDASILPAVIGSNPDAPSAIVIGPAYTLEGLVVDPSGRPVPRALVTARLPQTFRARFAVPMDNSIETVWQTVTSGSGAFELDELSYVPGMTLHVSSQSHGARTLPLRRPNGSRRQLDVQLPGLVGTEVVAAGVVRDVDGTPLPGVCVAYGSDHVHSDDSGKFRVYGDAAGSGNRASVCPPQDLALFMQGHGPLVLPRPRSSAAAQAGWGTELDLRLMPLAEPVRGVVRGSDGRPVAGVRVELALPEALRSRATRFACAETSLDLLSQTVTTDELGEFELPGLQDRDVGLLCIHPGDLRWARIDSGLRAGTTVEVPFPSETDLEPRWVRVVDDRGTPLSGAKLTAWASPLPPELKDRERDRRSIEAQAVHTDERGLALLPPLVISGIQLRVTAPDLMPTTWSAHDSLAPGAIEVVVPRRSWLVIDLMDQGGAFTDYGCYARVIGEDGEVLSFYQQFGHSGATSPIMPLESGRSPVVAVPAEAKTVEILRGPDLIGLVHIEPRPGEVLEVTRTD